MANSISQTRRHGTAEVGSLKTAQNNDPRELARLYGNPFLGRAPDYIVDALTDDAVAFKVWDSSDPLNNSNATSEGVASPALSFPANSRTKVAAIAEVANDDTIGIIGVEALVAGSATAPTLRAGFFTQYVIRGTYATTSTVATRTVASSSAGTTMTHSTTGDVDVTYPSLTSPVCLHASWAPIVANPAVTARLSVTPFSVATAAAKILAFDMDTPSVQANGPDASIVTAVIGGLTDNREFFRDTQIQSGPDVGDTLCLFGINATPTPDSLKLEVTGIASAELRWNVRIWIGDSQSVAFRTQV